jgi:hypothetical protein
MKLPVLKYCTSLRALLQTKEARFVTARLLYEALVLSLVALAALLSLESILPGTISLRTGVLFFILGIAILLVAERALSRALPELKNSSSGYSPKKKRFFLGLFSFWILFLLGNSLLGFHPSIVISIILLTFPLLWLFFIWEDDGGKVSH